MKKKSISRGIIEVCKAIDFALARYDGILQEICSLCFGASGEAFRSASQVWLVS